MCFHLHQYVALCCSFSRFSWPLQLFLASAFDRLLALFGLIFANFLRLSKRLWKLFSKGSVPMRTPSQPSSQKINKEHPNSCWRHGVQGWPVTAWPKRASLNTPQRSTTQPAAETVAEIRRLRQHEGGRCELS